MSLGNELGLKVLSPEGIILEAHNLDAVNVPLVDGGTIGIRRGHAPLIAETIQGPVVYKQGADLNSINLHAGVLDIRNNLVTILTAGEVEQTSSDITQPAETEFDRLIQTLINHTEPDNE